MSETSDLAKEVRKLRGELATLRNEFAQVRGRQDVWAANGLDDLDAGHGYQRYGAGALMRINDTGIQIQTTADLTALRWLNEFLTKAEIDAGINAYTHAQLSGYAISTGAGFTAAANSVPGLTESYLTLLTSSTNATSALQAEISNNGVKADVLASATRNVFRVTGIGGIVVAIALPSGAADPTFTLADGDLWYRSDTDKLRARINGATENLATESYVGTAAAPIGADYLVGTANASLTGEIVVGTAPGGELGGTWASPTVDATHSGTPHSDYVPLASANYVDLTDGGATTLHTHAGGSGWTPAITAQVAGYTAVKNDVVLCTGTFTVTLTAAATVATGGIIMVKNVSTGTIIVDGNAAETIDGALTITLAQYDSVMLITNGSNWFVI